MTIVDRIFTRIGANDKLIEGKSTFYIEMEETKNIIPNMNNNFDEKFNKDNNEYLCCSSVNGYINIWDLYNKKIFKVINTNGCELAHIIEWNNKYIIVADFNNKLFKIIDIDNNSIHDIKIKHKNNLKCIKKINHPIYGESLLSAGQDKIIKLWTIE